MGKKKKSLKQRYADHKVAKQLRKSRGENVSMLKRLAVLFNHYILFAFAFICVYFILLYLLVRVERNVPGATIHNMGEAVWYSLATFTTVGYGDFYPITPMGRLIASVFLVLGIGLLGFFVGFMVEFIARVRPAIILSLNAGKPWYIFTDRSPHAMIFAENLKKVRPDAMIIYAETKDDDKSSKFISVSWTVKELIDRRGSLYDAHIMCMKENEMENFLDAVELSDIDAPIICLADFTPAHHPININFFSLTDCTARIFWQQYPIINKHETILLIGFGNAGSVMLDRALELNVLYEDQSIHYHIFGESSEYIRNRKQLSQIAGINEAIDNRDCIFFHNDLWNSDENLLANADRIVLCADSEEENIMILHTIQKFFSIRGELYIYNSNVRSVATPFGQTRDVLTPAFVLHNCLSDMALCRHELFRYMYGGDIPMWEDLNSLVKDMNYVATDHVSIKVRMLLGEEAPKKPFDEIPPEMLRKAAARYDSISGEEKESLRRVEHQRNLRFYLLHNFRYGEELNDELRINPLIRSFDELDEKGKVLSDTAWILISELASHKEAKRR
ncbi:MAG: potassium channel family protein [Lachnospiraceae bacterium]|nr:potassium channel family protein [Lachnospiraceae bacterium]